jgi:hypothetical protein
MPATVTGRLTDARGNPLASKSFQLKLTKLEEPTAGTLASLATHTTDGSGNFSIPNVYRGKYVILYNREQIKIRVPLSTGSFIISNILDI